MQYDKVLVLVPLDYFKGYNLFLLFYSFLNKRKGRGIEKGGRSTRRSEKVGSLFKLAQMMREKTEPPVL